MVHTNRDVTPVQIVNVPRRVKLRACEFWLSGVTKHQTAHSVVQSCVSKWQTSAAASQLRTGSCEKGSCGARKWMLPVALFVIKRLAVPWDGLAGTHGGNMWESVKFSPSDCDTYISPTPLPLLRQELFIASQRKSAFQHGWTCGLNIVLVITASPPVCSASQLECFQCLHLWWLGVFWKLYMITNVWLSFCVFSVLLPETWIVLVLRIGHWSRCLLRRCSKLSMTSSPISSSLMWSWSTKRGRSSCAHWRTGRTYSNRKWVSPWTNT